MNAPANEQGLLRAIQAIQEVSDSHRILRIFNQYPGGALCSVAFLLERQDRRLAFKIPPHHISILAQQKETLIFSDSLDLTVRAIVGTTSPRQGIVILEPVEVQGVTLLKRHGARVEPQTAMTAEISLEAQSWQGTIVNISEGGCSVTLAKGAPLLPRQQDLAIAFTLEGPGDNPDVFQTTGQVTWTGGKPGNELFGLEFSPRTPRERYKLVHFVASNLAAFNAGAAMPVAEAPAPEPEPEPEPEPKGPCPREAFFDEPVMTPTGAGKGCELCRYLGQSASAIGVAVDRLWVHQAMGGTVCRYVRLCGPCLNKLGGDRRKPGCIECL